MRVLLYYYPEHFTGDVILQQHLIEIMMFYAVYRTST